MVVVLGICVVEVWKSVGYTSSYTYTLYGIRYVEVEVLCINDSFVSFVVLRLARSIIMY